MVNHTGYAWLASPGPSLATSTEILVLTHQVNSTTSPDETPKPKSVLTPCDPIRY